MIRNNPGSPDPKRSPSAPPDAKSIPQSNHRSSPPTVTTQPTTTVTSWEAAEAAQDKRKRGSYIESRPAPPPNVLYTPSKSSESTSYALGRSNQPKKKGSPEQERVKTSLESKNRQFTKKEDHIASKKPEDSLKKFSSVTKPIGTFIGSSSQTRQKQQTDDNMPFSSHKENTTNSQRSEALRPQVSQSTATATMSTTSQAANAQLQVIGEKRPRQISPPASKSSKPKMDDYEEPRPPQKKSNFLANFRASSEAKTMESAQLLSQKIAAIEKVKKETRTRILIPNDITNRKSDFGTTFLAKGKEQKIINKHPDLGLKTDSEVRNFASQFWAMPLSSTVIEKSQKDGTLIRLDKSSGIVAMADIEDIDSVAGKLKNTSTRVDIDKIDSIGVKTTTIFNPGITRRPKSSPAAQRQASLDYFNES